MKYLVEAWDNASKTWEPLRTFDDRTSADKCVRGWERDGYKVRVSEVHDV